MNRVSRILCAFTALFAISKPAHALEGAMYPEWSLMLRDAQVGPISEISHLVTVEPPWKQYYLLTRSEKDMTYVNRSGYAELVHTPSPGSKFHLTKYSATVGKDPNTATVVCQGKMLENIPGNFEYSAFFIPDYLVPNAKYTSVNADGSTSKGIVPAEPGALKDIGPFTELTLNLMYGTVKIKVKRGVPMLLMDRRKNSYILHNGLWIGCLSVPVDKQPFDSEIDFTFLPDPAKKITPLAGAVNVTEKPALTECVLENPPKDAKVNTFLIIPKVYTPGEAAAPTDKRGLTLTGAFEEIDRQRLTRAVAQIGELPAPLELKLVTGKSGCFAHTEAFRIVRSNEKIEISAATPQALRYAISELRDIDLSQCFILEDWPDIDFRGVHMMVDAGTPGLGRFFVDEVWTRGRINHVVLECQWAHWDATRAAWQEGTMEKEDLRKFVEYCRDNYIEPIPCVRLLSHTEWLFGNNANTDLRECPTHAYNYNISNPRTWEVITALLDEVIDVFHPQYLHIGHDEVDGAGVYEFPYQEEHKKMGMAEVVYQSITRLHKMLADRGIRTMLWHDSFMAPSETAFGHGMRMDNPKAFRARLPKDLVVMLWDYSDRGAKDAIETLQKEGFTVIGCPWYEPENIDKLVPDCAAANAGVCDTSWWSWCAGWDLPDGNMQGIEAHLRTAAGAWNVKQIGKMPEQLYGDIVSCRLYETREQYEGVKRPGYPKRSGLAVDLAPYANYQLEKNDPLLKLKTVPNSFPKDPVHVGAADFLLPSRNGKPAAVALRSYPDAGVFPEYVDIPVNMPVRRVYLLGALAGRVPRYDTYSLCFTYLYADGTERELRLLYNREIGHVHGHSSMDLNAFGRYPVADALFWCSVPVQNPQISKPVKAVRVKSAELPFLLLGVTIDANVPKIPQK